MNDLLITGFAPFGGETINPAWEAVRRLPDEIGTYWLHKLEIPTVFGRAAEITIEAANTIGADVILCIGQAGGRAAVTPEAIGINHRYASIPDNAGNCPADSRIMADTPAAYFSTVPVRRMADAIADAGILSAVSFTAGTFVCNDLLYTLLHTYRDSAIRVGFIHVPFLPEQVSVGKATPSMPLSDIVCALTAAIRML